MLLEIRDGLYINIEDRIIFKPLAFLRFRIIERVDYITR